MTTLTMAMQVMVMMMMSYSKASRMHIVLMINVVREKSCYQMVSVNNVQIILELRMKVKNVVPIAVRRRGSR